MWKSSVKLFCNSSFSQHNFFADHLQYDGGRRKRCMSTGYAVTDSAERSK